MQFIYVTSSKNKYEEFTHLFPYPVIWENLELTEIQGTLEEIALYKVNQARQKLLGDSVKRVMIIVDDVALYFRELGTFPGPYIKHFLTIEPTNIFLLLKDISKKTSVCCALGIVYYDDISVGMKTECLVGQVWGTFVFGRETKNRNAFGFDKYFLQDGCNQTYAEMSFMEKNVISHRGQAILKLIKFCTANKLHPPADNDASHTA